MSEITDLSNIIANLPLAESVSGLTAIMTSAQGELQKTSLVKNGTNGAYFLSAKGMYLFVGYDVSDPANYSVAVALSTDTKRVLIPLKSEGVELYMNTQGSVGLRNATEPYYIGFHIPFLLP